MSAGSAYGARFPPTRGAPLGRLSLERTMKTNWRNTAVLPVLLILGCASGSQKDEPGTPLVAQWEALTSGAVDATMSIQSDWKSGYCSDITVKNNGTTTVTGWTAVLNLHQSAISSAYGAKFTGSTFTPES